MKKILLLSLIVFCAGLAKSQTTIILKDYTRYNGAIVDSSGNSIKILLQGKNKPNEFYRSDILLIEDTDSLEVREQARASAAYTNTQKQFLDTIPESATNYKRIVYHGFSDVRRAGQLGVSGMVFCLAGGGIALAGALTGNKAVLYAGSAIGGVSIPLFISSFAFLIRAGSMPAPKNDSWKTKW